MTGHHAERRYFRVLPLADFGIAGDFEVTTIRLVAGEAPGFLTGPRIGVRLHSLAGERLLANLTLIVEQAVEVPAPAPAEIELAFAEAVIPGGHALVLEIFVPGDQNARDDHGRGVDDDGGGPGRAAPPARAAEPALIDTTSGVQLRMTILGRER
jgi:hypothetical protein